MVGAGVRRSVDRDAAIRTAPASSSRITQGSRSIAPAPVEASEPVPALLPAPLPGPTGPVGVGVRVRSDQPADSPD